MYSSALGYAADAGGYYNKASSYQTVTGRYATYNPNTATSTNDTGVVTSTGLYGTLFKIGQGNAESTRRNAFRVCAAGTAGTAGGTIYYGTAKTSGADYAENYEWTDGNEDGEDRRGLFVTLDGGKIRPATAEDDYILGIVSSTPAVIGDSPDLWNNMYLTDVFGNPLKETVTGEDGEESEQFVLNPDYDPELEYIPRDLRKEWSPVGTHGKLVAIDDGSCTVNGYCYPSANGLCTADTVHKIYRVIERLDQNHVRVVLK